MRRDTIKLSNSSAENSPEWNSKTFQIIQKKMKRTLNGKSQIYFEFYIPTSPLIASSIRLFDQLRRTFSYFLLISLTL